MIDEQEKREAVEAVFGKPPYEVAWGIMGSSGIAFHYLLPEVADNMEAEEEAIHKSLTLNHDASFHVVIVSDKRRDLREDEREFLKDSFFCEGERVEYIQIQLIRSPTLGPRSCLLTVVGPSRPQYGLRFRGQLCPLYSVNTDGYNPDRVNTFGRSLHFKS